MTVLLSCINARVSEPIFARFDELFSLRVLLDKFNPYIIADREDGIKTPDDWYGCFASIDATDIDSIIDNFLHSEKKVIAND